MRKYTAKGEATKSVVFPGIAAWLARNNMTVHALALIMGYQPSAAAAVYHCLYGNVEPSMRTIRKILAATGMTFEEAFGGVEDAEA